MASSWGTSWDTAWGDSWGIARHKHDAFKKRTKAEWRRVRRQEEQEDEELMFLLLGHF